MRKVSRLLFAIGAGIVALLIVILIGANLYVQSEGTQARIQQELSHRLGATLRLGRTSVTPWGGLKISGISIPEDLPDRHGDFLNAKTFRLRLRLFSLFSKRLVIREISLVEPNVVWAQNEKGKWQLPGAKKEEPLPEPAEVSPSPAAETPSAPAVTPSAAQDRQVEVAKVGHSFQPEIRHINVGRGNFRFLDRSGTAVATFEALNFRSTLGAGRELRGQANVQKVSLRERFFLSDLKTPVLYDAQKLELPQMSAHSAGGDLSGSFAMQPESPDSPFSFNVKFRNLQADQLVTEAGGPSGMVRGILEGSFAAEGKTAEVNEIKGAGEIFLRDGQLQQYSLLVALGQILQIEELTQLHLEQAQAKYHVTPGLVTVDELILRSRNIRLSATGTIGFNGKLRLESQLAINDKVRDQLFKQFRQNFQPISEPGYSAVDFQVSGTLDRPKSNLVEKVVGRDLKDLGGMINSLLGGSKSERKKKKSSDAASTESAAPSPTSTP